MKIRLLAPADAKNYWELRLEALKQNPEAFLTVYEEAVIRENPVEQTALNFAAEGNYTFGAFDGDRLVGMVTLLREGAKKLQHRANIFAMYVMPEKRGLGAGKLLMQGAIEKAMTIEGLEKINLTVTASNENAKKLYCSFGFKTFGYEEKALKYEGVYFDEEHMVLQLK